MTEGAVIVGYGGLHLAEKRSTTRHALHAIKVLVPIEGTMTYEGAHVIRTRAPVIVPADHPHAASCDGVSLCFFVEPEAHDGRLRSWSRAREAIVLHGSDAERMRAHARDVARGTLATRDALDDAAAILLATSGPASRLDGRVKAALTLLDAKRPVLRAIAAEVGLSPYHLAHRVKDELGIPLSRLVLFRRLMRAHERVLRGEPLAAAGRDAGFADQAHFSRTTRHMLGQPPSFVAATAFKTATSRAPIVRACTDS